MADQNLDQETFDNCFREVQEIQRRNEFLINQIGRNHQSLTHENVAQNVGLLNELNYNIARLQLLYNDLGLISFLDLLQQGQGGGVESVSTDLSLSSPRSSAAPSLPPQGRGGRGSSTGVTMRPGVFRPLPPQGQGRGGSSTRVTVTPGGGFSTGATLRTGVFPPLTLQGQGRGGYSAGATVRHGVFPPLTLQGQGEGGGGYSAGATMRTDLFPPLTLQGQGGGGSSTRATVPSKLTPKKKRSRNG